MLGVTVLVWLTLSLAYLEDAVSTAILMNLILTSLNALTLSVISPSCIPYLEAIQCLNYHPKSSFGPPPLTICCVSTNSTLLPTLSCVSISYKLLEQPLLPDIRTQPHTLLSLQQACLVNACYPSFTESIVLPLDIQLPNLPTPSPFPL